MSNSALTTAKFVVFLLWSQWWIPCKPLPGRIVFIFYFINNVELSIFHCTFRILKHNEKVLFDFDWALFWQIEPSKTHLNDHFKALKNPWKSEHGMNIKISPWIPLNIPVLFYLINNVELSICIAFSEYWSKIKGAFWFWMGFVLTNRTLTTSEWPFQGFKELKSCFCFITNFNCVQCVT